MDTDEISREKWDAQKKLVNIVGQQQQQIEILFSCYYRLIDLLRGEAGMESRPPEQAKSEEALERMKSGIAELERMFADGLPPRPEEDRLAN